MTDTKPSGDSLAPAADSPAPAASAETPAGSFGSTRGSGLVRGKRPSGAAAPATSPVKTDYKPTALEVITPQREYKNPFASQEPASAPAAEPAKVEIPEAPVAAVQPKPDSEPRAPVSPEPVAERQEIQILPPADAARPAVSWESPSAQGAPRDTQADDRPQRDDRPAFRADRRGDKGGAREPEGQRPRFEGREPHRDSFQRQPRDPREARQPRDPRDQRPQYAQGAPGTRSPEAGKPVSGGFFGWLRSLFGGKKPVEAPVGPDSGGEQFGDGHRHRRRHRGGRSHGGNYQGFREERPEQAGGHENRGGDRQGDYRRRRHRGGSGRDRGGDPRSEGHQGGGAI
jgi:hypothetical protein